MGSTVYVRLLPSTFSVLFLLGTLSSSPNNCHAIPLLHIGHHPEQTAATQRRQLNVARKRRLDDTPGGGLDDADCKTGRLPTALLKLENQLPTGACITEWEEARNFGGTWFFYPQDFGDIRNQVEEYECSFDAAQRPDSRVIYSNGFPDHSVRWGNPNVPCEKFWYLEMPKNPVYVADQTWEPPPGGIVAIALNGMPIYGAQEAQPEVGNAMEPDVDSIFAVFDARFWYGHSTSAGVAHYHNPAAGKDIIPSEDTLLGFALDGFPLYGPVPDADIGSLDRCNGRMVDPTDPSTYRYHVRTVEQVDELKDYCPTNPDDANRPFVQWNYIVGCYHADPNETEIRILDVIEPFPTRAAFPYPGDRCTLVNRERNNNEPSGPSGRPNVIIIQPDDLPFYDNWVSPPNNPSDPDTNVRFPQRYSFPHMERLRENGVQLRQAYAASSACGTSRFSTLTGKYPSRAGTNRIDTNRAVATVTIPNTRLQDVGGSADCSAENLAVAMRNAGYRTGVTGKWHLFDIDDATYSYGGVQDAIVRCGFDFADGIYPENLSNDILQGEYHNMEWVVKNAIDFINQEDDDPFLLYFNPTVPHSGGDVYEALKASCRRTPGGLADEDFIVKGMTLEYGGCERYREFVVSRSNITLFNDDVTDGGFLRELGAIWLDDAIGALIHALVDKGIFEDTLIIFQQDHGLEAKNTLFENGSRIAQFVHYPNFYGTEGSRSFALVSTVDVAPTIIDFAGTTLPYDHDGKSWRTAILTGSLSSADRRQDRNFFLNERCLLLEYQRDRAVRCGCGKIMRLTGARNFFDDSGSLRLPTSAPTSLDDVSGRSSTFTLGTDLGFFNEAVTQDNPTFIYDLCNGGGNFRGDYITGNDLRPSGVGNPEAVDLLRDGITSIQGPQLREALLCFLNSTDAQSEPDFDADCSRLYSPVCDSDSDCEHDTLGRTICTNGGGICVSDQTPAPSSSPSTRPSTEPSGRPSTSPIDPPSSMPSKSQSPSSQPLPEPSMNPIMSQHPSAIPSIGPSHTPSLRPTANPVAVPAPPPGNIFDSLADLGGSVGALAMAATALVAAAIVNCVT